MTLPVGCVDFDGVLASWEEGSFAEPGPPIRGAQAFVEELASFSRVIIWTCRTTEARYDESHGALQLKIWGWLVRWGFSGVSEVYAGQGKPYAAFYIDDKGVHCDPEHDTQAFATSLKIARAMCNNGKQHINNGVSQ